MMKPLFTLLMLLATNILFGQQPKATTSVAPTVKPGPRDSAVMKLFDKSAKLEWIRHFKGRVDEVALADISLGFDGRQCKGYMVYIKSKVRFRLEGTLAGAQLNLEERDPANVLTGKISGVLEGRRLNLDWSNAAGTLGSRIVAEEPQPGQVINPGCGENKWASRYIARYNGARADMVLIRMQNQALDGFLWIESDGGKTYALKGELKEDGQYELEALLPSGKTAALLEGNIKNLPAHECRWVGSGEKRTINFTLKDKMLFGCYDYADYRASYDAIFPRSNCSACNTWLDKAVNAWAERCKTTLQAIKEPLNAESRAKYRAGGWPEVVCWTENVFSGYLVFTDTWSEQSQGKSFNFDLRSNKEITFVDLFNKTFNAQAWLDEYVKKESPKLPQFAADPAYRNWIAKEGFPLFAIRRDGLELSTLFHPVYGLQKMLVPYAELKMYMKKENPIQEFIKN